MVLGHSRSPIARTASIGILALMLGTILPRTAAADLPRDADSYVLLAQDRLVIGAKGVVTGGNVGVNEYRGKFARIGDRVQIQNGVLASSQVKLEVLSSIQDLFANSVEQQLGAMIGGATAPFGTTPILTYDPLPPFAPSLSPLDDVQVPENTIVGISPGAYRRLRVRKRATVVLAPGIYDLDELRVYDGGGLRAQGPVEIRVRRMVNFGARVFVGPQPSSLVSPADVRIVTGARTIKVGLDGVILGTIFAPQGFFRTRDLFSIVGQIVARRIELHPGSTTEPTPECGNDVLELGEECDGSDAPTCPGLCQPDCTCGTPATPTPTPTSTVEPPVTPTPPPTPTPTPEPTETPAPTETPQPTETPGPTETPPPSATPPPTATPAPTATPVPTATPTPTNGSPTCGDGIVQRPLEECDDGNLVNGDGCSTTCNLEPGEYCTFTQGGWGAKCSGNNPGCLRDQGFPGAFPTGLRIGDLAGPDGAGNGFTAHWTTSQAVEDFLPAGGTSGALTGDLVDATTTPAGNIAGQLVGVKLDVAIAGLPDDMHLLGCVAPNLRDLTVAQLIAAADAAVATGTLPPGVSFSDLAEALTAVNENFDNCTANEGCLGED